MKNTQLIGKAKELHAASILVSIGVFPYLPVIDNGYDLVASNREGTKFIPVQVKYSAERLRLGLAENTVARYMETGVVLVFSTIRDNDTEFYFIPFHAWLKKARQNNRERADKMIYPIISTPEGRKWVEQFKGIEGAKMAFKKIA